MKLLLFFLIFIPGLVYAEKFAGPYPVLAHKVIDGDTVAVLFPIWFGQTIQTNLRIIGIDAPETRKGIKGGERIKPCEIRDGNKAAAYLKNLIANKKLTIRNIKQDAYPGRHDGALHIVTDNGIQSVADKMIKSGNAVAYDYKSARRAWLCKTPV